MSLCSNLCNYLFHFTRIIHNNRNLSHVFQLFIVRFLVQKILEYLQFTTTSGHHKPFSLCSNLCNYLFHFTQIIHNNRNLSQVFRPFIVRFLAQNILEYLQFTTASGRHKSFSVCSNLCNYYNFRSVTTPVITSNISPHYVTSNK